MFITKKSTLSTVSAFLLFGLLRLVFVEAFLAEADVYELIDSVGFSAKDEENEVQAKFLGVDFFSEKVMNMLFPGASIQKTCFDLGDKEHCYFSYIPKKCEDNFWQKPRPLVVDIHALSVGPYFSALFNGWKKIAEDECLIMMWPMGAPYSKMSAAWNIPGGLQSEDYGTEGGNNVTTTSCCYNFRRDPNTGPDHPLVLKKAIDHLVADLAEKPESPVVVDESRIYVTGHSNGGKAALAIAGLYSDTIAAVAVFAGMLGTPFAEDYSGVPIWMVHGTDDDLWPYEGVPTGTAPSGPDIIFKPTPNVGVWSMDQTIEYLSEQNQCSGKIVTGTTGGTITKFDECKQGASVELLTLDGVGHFPINFPFIGTKLPTTQMAWDFLKLQSKSATTSTSNGAESGAKSSTGSEL